MSKNLIILIAAVGFGCADNPDPGENKIGLSPNSVRAVVGDTGKAAAPDKRLELSIHLERQIYRADEPISLQVVTKNAQDADAFLGFTADHEMSFDFIVSYVDDGVAKSRTMPLTRYGTKLKDPVAVAGNGMVGLKPGEQQSCRFLLNRIVDLTLAGKYKVIVHRTVPPLEPKNRVLISNELTVEVAEPPEDGR